MAQLKWLLPLLLSLPLWAQQAADAAPPSGVVPVNTTKAEKPVITELKDLAGSNSIPLLDNRFRIDYEVDEVTLVFFRKKGAQSIVLVKPDGSKVYARTAKDHNMQWFDDKTYDLIKMTKPTPGPWQAIGEILPQSRIMVLTEIDLKAAQLPKDLMLGEIFKVTARLSNGGKPINAKDFADILQLDVVLISTQKAGYDNENAAEVDFASFQDDGKNYDEKPRDAIFTGEFNLQIQAGEWLPKFVVKTPLYTRELMQEPIVVSPVPLNLVFTEAVAKESRHQLLYQLTSDQVAADSLSIQGRLLYPDGEVQSFVLAEQPGAQRLLEIANTGPGKYRIEQMIFGKTAAGREFVIHYPEYQFEVAAPVEPVSTEPAAAEPQAAVPSAHAQSAGTNHSETTAPAAKATAEFPLALVIGVNVLILIGGGVAILLSTNSMLLAKLNPLSVLRRKKSAPLPVSAATAAAAENTAEPAKKPPKNKASDDILDLSLPDD